jgi:hypothetical protein
LSHKTQQQQVMLVLVRRHQASGKSGRVVQERVLQVR